MSEFSQFRMKVPGPEPVLPVEPTEEAPRVPQRGRTLDEVFPENQNQEPTPPFHHAPPTSPPTPVAAPQASPYPPQAPIYHTGPMRQPVYVVATPQGELMPQGYMPQLMPERRSGNFRNPAVVAAGIALAAFFLREPITTLVTDKESTTQAQLQGQSQAQPTMEASPTANEQAKKERKKSPKEKKTSAAAKIPVANATQAPSAKKPAPAPNSAAFGTLTPDQQEQLRLFVPQAIACEAPIASMHVESTMNVNFVLRKRLGGGALLAFNSKGKVPYATIDDAVDVAVCASKAAMQSAVHVNAKTGVISVDTEELLRPSFRKASAGAKGGRGLMPQQSLWRNMQQDPAARPQFTKNSILAVNASLGQFSQPKLPASIWAFNAHEISALRHVNGMPHCIDTLRSAVKRRLDQIISQQAADQGVEKYRIEQQDHFSLSSALYRVKGLKPQETRPIKGGGYRFGEARTTCQLIKGSR